MPLLDLSRDLTFRCPPVRSGEDLDRATAGAAAAGWLGVVLPAASVLGVTVFPVVELTGARERIAGGVGPERSLSTLALWESLATGDGAEGLVPPAPLRIAGFVSTASRWDRALAGVQGLAGLGAGLVLRQRRPSTLQLLDADADDVWVAAVNDETAELYVRGRSGPLASAFRVPATRLIEEGLFAHALACGALDDEPAEGLPR
jgi:hypothetical protein